MMLAALLAAGVLAQAPFPGAPSAPVCGREGIPYPQSALTTGRDGLWLACRRARKLLLLDARKGATRRMVKTPGLTPFSVAVSGRRVWAIDRDRSTLAAYDTRSGKQRARIMVPGQPDVLWAGRGYIWVAFADLNQVARVDPATRRVKLIRAGDGVSAFTTDGKFVYVLSHRDNALVRIDPRVGRSKTVRADIVPSFDTVGDPSGATEHVAYLNGSFWITGRGLGVLRVNPSSGVVQATIPIGSAGGDVIATRERIVVLAATEKGAARGDPIVASVQSIDPATNAVASTVTAGSTLYAGGLAVAGGHVWIADIVGGLISAPS
jgi:streptogramin lyase